MKQLKKFGLLLCAFSLSCAMLSGCSGTDGKRIVRIGHNQSTNHPTHIALTAFKDYINEQLGDHYVVEVYPSELLGSQTDMVQLTQTGAIDYCISAGKEVGKVKNLIVFAEGFQDGVAGDAEIDGTGLGQLHHVRLGTQQLAGIHFH